MKTFSAMSVPDKILTKKSYLMNIAFLNQLLATEKYMPEERVMQMKKEICRLQTLIDAIDADILTE